MSARFTELEFAELLSRRGMKTKTHSPVAPVRREASQQVKHDYKAELLQQLGLVGIKVEPEFYFARPRKFRSDWRVVETRVLIEFEGGLFKRAKGGHSSVTGILRDIEKYNEAALRKWLVIRVTPKHVVSGEALRWIERAITSQD